MYLYRFIKDLYNLISDTFSKKNPKPMSKPLTVTATDAILTPFICDVCGKEIPCRASSDLPTGWSVMFERILLCDTCLFFHYASIDQVDTTSN